VYSYAWGCTLSTIYSDDHVTIRLPTHGKSILPVNSNSIVPILVYRLQAHREILDNNFALVGKPLMVFNTVHNGASCLE